MEVPYVAASQWPTKQVKEEERDTIVVVGQVMQKCKRTKTALQQNGSEGSNDFAADEVPSSTRLEKEEEESNVTLRYRFTLPYPRMPDQVSKSTHNLLLY